MIGAPVCVSVSQSDTVSTVLLALVNDFSCNSINIIHLNTLMLPLNTTTTPSAVKHPLALTLNSEWLTLHTHTGQREWVSISGWKTLTGWFNQCKNSIENRHTHMCSGCVLLSVNVYTAQIITSFLYQLNTSINQTQETLKIGV